MKVLNIIITSLIIMFLLTSCEKVIEIDLNSSAPALVAEGLIEKDSVAWLKLSYTTDYFDNEESKKVENAKVTLEDNQGNFELMEYIGDGIYRGASIVGETNMSYTMVFENEDFTKEAYASLQLPTEIYSITFEKSVMGPPGQSEEHYQANFKLKNLSSNKEYYMLKFWVNQKEDKGMYYLINDEYYIKNDTVEYSPFQLQLDLNDQLDVIVYSIDASSYDYYYKLNEVGGGGRMGGSSTPYNPQSNFGEDVLGYFTAWSFTTESTIVE